MDFQQFKKLNLSEIKKWKNIRLSEEEIFSWKKNGNLVDKLYEMKVKKIYLEYVRIKLQNMIALQSDSFQGYDPIAEAERIIGGFAK